MSRDRCIYDPYDQCTHECEDCPQYIEKEEEGDG